jgi:hypothetical protein
LISTFGTFKGLAIADGQSLVKVAIKEERAAVFKFDSGGWLETDPVDIAAI